MRCGRAAQEPPLFARSRCYRARHCEKTVRAVGSRWRTVWLTSPTTLRWSGSRAIWSSSARKRKFGWTGCSATCNGCVTMSTSRPRSCGASTMARTLIARISARCSRRSTACAAGSTPSSASRPTDQLAVISASGGPTQLSRGIGTPALNAAPFDRSAGRRRLHHRPDPFGVRRRRGIVDHHGEVCSAVDRKGRIFEGDRAESWMAYVLDGLAMVAANVIFAPHRPEFGAEPAEVLDERLHLRRGSGALRIHPERADHKARDALPVILRSAGARLQEDEAQDVALLRRQRSIVHEHHGRRPVPGHDVPNRGPDHGRARVQRVEHALQPRRHAFVLPVARLRRSAEAEQEEVLALDVRQHERAGDPVEHVGRRRAAAPLLEPSVPGRADVGALRHFFAAQAGRAAAPRGKAERRRIELGAAVLQIESEPVLERNGYVHPVKHYNGITSLLYYNGRKAQVCLPRKQEAFSCAYLSPARPAGSARPSSRT